MNSFRTAVLIGSALFSSVAVSRADTVQLRSGAILVGDVTLLENGAIQIAARFPREETLTYEREDLMPRSLYDVLDRRTDRDDADGRLDLGELAESNGLYGLAISDYLAVARLRPDLATDMKARVGRVREAIATGILDDARDLLDQGNPRGALMYLHTLQELYPDTEPAKRDAKELMKTAHEHAGESTDVAEKTVSADRAPKVIEGLEKDLEKGDREARKLRGHEGDSSKDEKAAEKAIKYYEAAWKDVKTLPVAVSDPDLQARIVALRRSTKEKLVKAYLAAGSIYLQRYSIPLAEEYCNKACELQPDDKANHDLHRLIIEAKIFGGLGWVAR